MNLTWITHVIGSKDLIKLYQKHIKNCKLCQDTNQNIVETAVKNEVDIRKAHLIESIISLEVEYDSDEKWYTDLKLEIEAIKYILNHEKLKEDELAERTNRTKECNN